MLSADLGIILPEIILAIYAMVALLGAVAAQYEDRLGFALGAMTASFVFFFSLGFGARLLAPFFAKPRAWQVLDVIIGIVMWAIAAKLLMM